MTFQQIEKLSVGDMIEKRLSLPLPHGNVERLLIHQLGIVVDRRSPNFIMIMWVDTDNDRRRQETLSSFLLASSAYRVV